MDTNEIAEEQAVDVVEVTRLQATQNALERLAGATAAANYIEEEYKERKAAIMATAPELFEKLEQLEVERSEKSQYANGLIAQITTRVKSAVLQIGETVRGSHLMAKWVKGRAGGYDESMLNGMAFIIRYVKAAKDDPAKLNWLIETVSKIDEAEKEDDSGYDAKKLEALSAIVPQIKAAKKPDGQPTVSICKI